MEPGDARWQRVSRGELFLTKDEIAAGWHFCPDFDEDLCRGDENGEGTRCQWCDYEPDEYQGF